jgi:hypothetical protein
MEFNLTPRFELFCTHRKIVPQKGAKFKFKLNSFYPKKYGGLEFYQKEAQIETKRLKNTPK